MPVLERPLKNIRSLPKALTTLPMNAVLHQEWIAGLKLIGLLILLGSPSLILILWTAAIYKKGIVGGVLVFFIIVGVIVSPGYLKLMYELLSSLVESKKAPWLVEPIEKPFNENYQIPWNKNILIFSFVITLVSDVWLVKIAFLDESSLRYEWFVSIVWILMLIVGHVGISLMLFISIVAYTYVRKNSKIYDQLLVRITKRVKGFTEGHESILSKKNYEVVGVLSDTPGLSIRSLGDIPILGLASSTLIFNAILFIIAAPWLIDGPIAETIGNQTLGGIDETGITFIIIIGLVISLIAALGAIIIPIFRIFLVIRRFKLKALTELDPFLFDEITGVALKQDSIITNETQVLYMLRNYIYGMKPSPVNPLRLLQVAALLILYVYKGVPSIISFFEIIGGLFS